MDQPRPIEFDAHPRWRHRKPTDLTTGLPADLLREQSIRIQLIYVLGSVLWTINLVMDHFWAPQGDRGPYRLAIEMLGIVLAAAVAGLPVSRHGELDPSEAPRHRRRDRGRAFTICDLSPI